MTATHVAKKCRSPLFGLAMIRQEADPPGPWQSGLFEVYAVRWENTRTGKAGWLPAVRGGWRKGVPHAERDYLPLTAEILASHLSAPRSMDVPVHTGPDEPARSAPGGG